MKKCKGMTMLLAAAVLMMLLAACGADKKDADQKADPKPEKKTDATTQATEGTDAAVVYFSATGNTKDIAVQIADITGADIYEIEAAKPYTDEDLDYNDDASRASVEQNDPDARPEIGGKDIDLAKYKFIFLGYPIWFGQAPRIMDTFVESHDLSDKIIVPFCTSGSSDIGGSADKLAGEAGGDWQTGKRFAAGATEDEIKEWLGTLK